MAAAAATGVQVGAAIVATRFVSTAIGPASLAFLRYLIGGLCLAIAAAWVRRSTPLPRFARRDLTPIALLGIGQFGILVALLNWGLRSVPSARGSLIFSLFPLLTMILATALGHERFTLRRGLGVAATILGVGCAFSTRLLEPAQRLSWGGEAAILASAAVGAVCSVLYRPYLRRYPALPMSVIAMAASVIFLAVPAAAEGLFTHVPSLAPAIAGAILFIGLSSGGGYYLWLWALGHAAATEVTIFLALSPITAALAGGLWLGEPVGTALGGAVLLVAGGLWLALGAKVPSR
jgi:drug/metabolite transporter (DMT)-like permease